jgi:glycosyltransferase involved in cell wall biosynthesis
VSQELKKALLINKIKCDDVAYNGINMADFDDSDKFLSEKLRKKYNLFGKKIILYAGRLSPAKGANQIISIFSQVRLKIADSILFVAGDSRGYEKEIQSADQGSIIFAGWLGEKEMRATYFLSDVVVFPSIYLEPFGLIVIEAMAAKKPVVGTSFGGVKEIIIDGETGFVVNPLDKEEFAEKIVRLLIDGELANKLGEKGYEVVREKFNLDKVAINYLGHLESLKNSQL